MARIVVITHSYDKFLRRGGLLFRHTSGYMLYDVLAELKSRGHEVEMTVGLSLRPTGDVAILHVDATFVPPEYIEYGRRFPLCLNGKVGDISKRRVSGAVLAAGDEWDGPVVVKSNFNCAGLPEFKANRRAKRKRQREPYPGVPAPFEYQVYESPAELPDGVFDDPALSVERYVAEPEPDGYAARFWVFCGEAERCTRYVSPKRLLKGGATTRQEPATVPDELRTLRRELGFDYGKFDFVVHRGEVILLDANKTPGRPRNAGGAGARHCPPGRRAGGYAAEIVRNAGRPCCRAATLVPQPARHAQPERRRFPFCGNVFVAPAINDHAVLPGLIVVMPGQKGVACLLATARALPFLFAPWWQLRKGRAGVGQLVV